MGGNCCSSAQPDEGTEFRTSAAAFDNVPRYSPPESDAGGTSCESKGNSRTPSTSPSIMEGRDISKRPRKAGDPEQERNREALTARERSTPQQPSAFDKASKRLLARLSTGLPILLFMSEGKAVESTMKCEVSEAKITLSRDKNFRIITFSEIDRVMHTPRDMSRIVGPTAKVADDPNCSALLLKTGGCIVMRFADKDDNETFHATLQHLLNQYNASMG